MQALDRLVIESGEPILCRLTAVESARSRVGTGEIYGARDAVDAGHVAGEKRQPVFEERPPKLKTRLHRVVAILFLSVVLSRLIHAPDRLRAGVSTQPAISLLSGRYNCLGDGGLG